MEKKKIAETINVRINVGNYQHIEISKYAEKEIEYDGKLDMEKQEDQLTEELLGNIIRNMRTIPGKLGKETTAVEEFEDRLTKTLPDFMKGTQEPNLAKKSNIQSEAEEKSNADKKEAKVAETEKVVENLVDESQEDKKEETVVETIDDDDLFG